MCFCVHLMQETEFKEILLKNTELNIINSDLQKQLDELGKVRVLLTNAIILLGFYCAMLCIAWTMLLQHVSIYLSITCWYSIKMVIHILKLFSLSCSHTILVFSHPTVWQYSDGDLPNGDIECKGGMKKSIFKQYLTLSRK